MAKVVAPWPSFGRPLLAVESSCDETSAAVVIGTNVRSNVVSSQADLHRQWGGVVPEAAARRHVEAILPVVDLALDEAGLALEDIEGFAVTNRPGLVGALSVGVCAVKALALATGKPFVGIHHLEGHLLSPFAEGAVVPFPHVALIVSGGHTELVEVAQPGRYRVVGHTIDDAAGEAFDKTARMLGLGYPGGAAIQHLAEGGDPKRYALPKGLKGETLNFSFAGLKTAVMRAVDSGAEPADLAASLQETVVAVLTERTMAAADQCGVDAVTVVGGVSANRRLREMMQREADRRGWRFAAARLDLCTDNAAMIGLAGDFRLGMGLSDTFDLDVVPAADLEAE
ncbi:MAG: tRNA (adenosine(37)-N6)-threonylcarbamoyltransferase complex transferase subunit TsaD [Fimbriimonadaceae bacterium]